MNDVHKVEIEKRIKETLRQKCESISPTELVQQIVQSGATDADTRDAAWRLLDSGEITVDKCMNLILPSESTE